MKEFQQYLDTKGKLKIVRTEALRAGFKECWQKKNYTTIVQMAKRVPDAVIQEDQALLMYFDNASLMSGRVDHDHDTPPSFAVGSWAFSAAHGESVRILDVETVWNHTVYQVWIPRLATVERVPADSLSLPSRRRRPASTASPTPSLPPGSPTL